MARQYGGDPFDFENMTDDEVRDVVRDQLRQYPTLDSDDVDVVVQEGVVTLSGRVGTDAEVQVATSVLDDVLGLESYVNELVVDELRRGETPIAGDDAKGADTDEGIGERAAQHSDTAEHLVEDVEAETFGTRDVGQAVRDATSYTPSDQPGSDGYGSREDH